MKRTNSNNESHKTGVSKDFSDPQRKLKSRALPISIPVALSASIILGGILGYVHPDEFFQNPEIASFLAFGNKEQLFIAWEFTSNYACRSIFPPWLTGIMFLGLQWLQSITRIPFVNTVTLFLLPKLLIAMASFWTIRWGLRTLIKNRSTTDYEAVMLTSWVFGVFHTRTFSNTLESLILIILFVMVGEQLYPLPHPSSSSLQSSRELKIGMMVALGIFTRFTFIFYAAPIGGMLLWNYFVYSQKSKAWKTIARNIAAIVLGVLGTSTIITVIDSWYYGRWELTPWNSLKYNMNSDNLASHGLHPRYLHVVVNLPLLFGPLLLPFLLKLIGWLSHPSLSPSEGGVSEIDKMAMMSVGMGVGMLSLAPHQEPRFLVPVFFPLLLLSQGFPYATLPIPSTSLPSTLQRWVSGRKVMWKYLWLIFNGIFIVFFGVMHQGGVVPSLFYLAPTPATLPLASSPTLAPQPQAMTVVYQGVFMPPRYLWNFNHNLQWEIIDSNGNWSLLHSLIQHPQFMTPNHQFWVVIPSTFCEKLRELTPKGFIFEERIWFPHLDTDKWAFSLHIFLLRKSE